MKASGSSVVIPWKIGKDDKYIGFIGAPPWVSSIGNSIVEVVSTMFFDILQYSFGITNYGGTC
jgi:hypothetical protein